MPYTEFVMWQAYLDKEMNTPGKLEYYLAQIAAEVRRGWVTDKNKVSMKDFLSPVKFVRKTLSKRGDIQKQNATKSFWLRGVGLIGKKRKK